MSEFLDFSVACLVPASRAVLVPAYAALEQGGELHVTTKTDGSPASDADRAAEQSLRALLNIRYPMHGIIGEEFGFDDPGGADYVWVLDPLDGTKEFLAREEGWGTLIGLLYKGQPVAGVIDEPLAGIVHAGETAPKIAIKALNELSIACTGPQTMFVDTPFSKSVGHLFAVVAKVRTRLNCLGFAYVAGGSIDLAVENDLKMHDIVALLPVLWRAGMVCYALDGMDYRDHRFDIADLSRSYSLITGLPDRVKQAFDVMEAA